MNSAPPQWALAFAGAFLLALVAEQFPKLGNTLLLVVVLGLLLAASRKGLLT